MMALSKSPSSTWSGSAVSQRNIRIVGFWPKGHKNAPPFPPGVGNLVGKPYSHLVAGKMIGPTRELELPGEVAWVVVLPNGDGR